MAFPDRFLDDVRARVGLADVVGRRVNLTRKGREHSGLCPFHKEKTPSFTVNEEKGFYHCFGCGAHGDVISFVMQTEGLSFPEAVEALATQAGLPIPVSSPMEREREQRRAGLHDAVEAAARWFEAQLSTPAGRPGLEYLQRRGLDDAAIRQFRLGYAPDTREGLKTALRAQGMDEALLVEAGLAIRPDDGRAAYDRFRGRVIFPIADRRGRVIAFGGRILGDGEPKYLNSPETPLFHKGDTLYGLAQALSPARASGELIVTEGYMDVIALVRAGFQGAVAPLGTALTEAQIQALWKIVDEPILAFDGDNAGQRAAARAAERALPLLVPGKSLRFAFLPRGEDPDSLIAGNGPGAMRAVLGAAEPLVAVLWRIEAGSRPVDTPEQRADLQARLLRQATRIGDTIVQEHYRQALMERVRGAFRPAYRPSGAPSGRLPFAGAARSQSARHLPANAEQLRRRQQQIVLAALINHPELLDTFGEDIADLGLDDDLDRLRQALHHCYSAFPGLDAANLKGHLSTTEFTGLIGALLSNGVYVHARFARVDASLTEAQEGLRHTIGLLRQARRREEVRDHGRRAAGELTPASESRFMAFRQEVERDERDLAEHADREWPGGGGDGKAE
ncbi:MAG: DNA primase [Alphaproteobacteria bacterium]